MAKVHLEAIARRFDHVSKIEDISFKVPDGQFWVLVGPSGCGKSTILRTIAGLEAVSEGKLYIGDSLVNQVPARARDVAMVFQNYALYPHMSVAENLAFGLRMRKVADKGTIAKRVEGVARSLNLSHLLDRKPKQLSGGQQQRVALGRAIAREPQVFLLDEPLSNLDAQLRNETRAELKRLHGQLGITTIYVTHDQVEAMTLADQIVVLDQGRIQQIGDPQAIYAQPANRMVATFLGSPAMNLFPATYLDGGFKVKNQSLAVGATLHQVLQPRHGQGFDLGIRPEHIQVQTAEQLDNSEQLQVLVDLLEPLGRETLIRASLPDSQQTLSFYAPANWRSQVGDFINIQLDLEQLFVFDASTGERLYPVTN
ncbi:MAG: sugar ABC transporter ATP-binding protein [Cyanobacteria bacterium SW_10_48_33]|nr:MAG: sugar ABC transporter ATP-binding protein [Cyanobacteria bacterium QS_5_48_63]PSP08220.1 MAG: sugar ABC transporter ATP-binding protein [Cyanobacteria bacterium SW_10_48_33]